MAESSVFKQKLTIGMLPEKMIVQYMDTFYLKAFSFYFSNGLRK